MTTREEAVRIAASEVAGRGLVASVTNVVAIEDCQRAPIAYGVCFNGCWIAYLDLPGRSWGVLPSTILAIDRVTGDILYFGSAGDEG